MELSFSGKQFPCYAGCGGCQHFLLALALGATVVWLGPNVPLNLNGDISDIVARDQKAICIERSVNMIRPHPFSSINLL